MRTRPYGFIALVMGLIATVPLPAAGPQVAIELRMPLVSIQNMRYPDHRQSEIDFELGGPMSGEARAARVIITVAKDDAGSEVQFNSAPEFLQPAVGSISRDEHLHPIPPRLKSGVSNLSPAATKLTVLEGRAEIVIPSLDPEATAIVNALPALSGKVIDSPQLRRAGVVIKAFLRPAFDAQMAGGGFADYGVNFDAKTLAGLPAETAAMIRRQVIPHPGDRDVALAINDPSAKLIGVEFTAADGSPLIYNRNGYAHYHNGLTHGRLALYRFEAPIDAGARMLCWLVTEKSLVAIPFHFTDLPLPPPRTALSPPAAHLTAPDGR